MVRSPCTVLHYHIIRWALYLVRIIKSHYLYVHQLINKTSSLNFRQRPQSTQNSLRRETPRKISGAGDYDLQNASRSTKASALDATLFEDKRCFSFRSLHYTERRSHVILSRSVLSWWRWWVAGCRQGLEEERLFWEKGKTEENNFIRGWINNFFGVEWPWKSLTRL